MSNFDSIYNDSEVICPYCGGSYQPESETYSEEVREEECQECGKKYNLSQSFSVTHVASPDCGLNGEEHDWVPIPMLNGKHHPFCTVCGKCMPTIFVD